MPTELTLPVSFRRARWKVKIQDKETREPPHVSILRGTDKWRINLRTGGFMDRIPKPSEVPKSLLKIIREEKAWKWLCQQWDNKYPDNPVSSTEIRDDADQHDSTDAS
jgi:hypothetical protein